MLFWLWITSYLVRFVLVARRIGQEKNLHANCNEENLYIESIGNKKYFENRSPK